MNLMPLSYKKFGQVVQEAIILAGSATAVLLQVAEPGVAKGVDRHSNFAHRPLNRLRTSVTYIYRMTFGTPEEKKSIIELVHRAHATVKGRSYSADDPKLQLWVAATLYAVSIELYQQVFGFMDDMTAETTYKEYWILAESLRVPLGMCPLIVRHSGRIGTTSLQQCRLLITPGVLLKTSFTIPKPLFKSVLSSLWYAWQLSRCYLRGFAKPTG
jgi:hypothetical protein